MLGSTTTCSDTPLLVTPRRAFADYDAANDRGPVAAAVRPVSYEMQRAARAHRALVIGEIVASAIHSVVATARRVRAHVEERRQARLNQDDFRRLDEHALRDLGLTRIDLSPGVWDPFSGLHNRT